MSEYQKFIHMLQVRAMHGPLSEEDGSNGVD